MTTAAAIPTIKEDRILILDFGSQYSQLIARRVRDSGVFCEMFPYDIDTQRIKDFGAKGVILSGGPESVHAENSPRINDAVFELGVPVLGIATVCRRWQIASAVRYMPVISMNLARRPSMSMATQSLLMASKIASVKTNRPR